MAINDLFDEAKKAVNRIDERALFHDCNFAKRADAENEKRATLLDLRVQRALENKGLESLTEIDKVIRAQCLLEVPKVALQVLDTISNNPGALLTQKVKGEIFALVEERTRNLRGKVKADLDEAKMELHTEINDLRTELEGGDQERRELRDKLEVLSQNPPAGPLPDPQLQQVPSMMHNVHRCLHQVSIIDQFCKGVETRAIANTSMSTRNFQKVAEQFSAQHQILTFLKGSNEKLQARNAKLEAKVEGGLKPL